MDISSNLKKAIENYIAGDVEAFTMIYNESHKYIYVCVNNVMSGNDNKDDIIQDIMQDTYVEISKHINSIQNINSFLSWAGTIATRKCYEYIKKAGKYTLLNEDENFDTLADDDNIIPEEIVLNKEKQRLLREIIQNELTEMQKLCVVGYFYNEMKQSEIAKELGIPENSVKSYLLRAKAKIKDSVIDLEKKKGTKLYSVTPILLLLFTEEVEACVVSPTIGQAVISKVGIAVSQGITNGVEATGAEIGTSTGTTSATKIGTTAARTAMVAVKSKTIAIVLASVVTIGGIGSGVGIAINNRMQSNEQTKSVKESTINEEESAINEEESTTIEMIIEDEGDIKEENNNIFEQGKTTPSKWDGIEIGECGEMYGMMMLAQKSTDTEIISIDQYFIPTMVESIKVDSEKIIVQLFDVENNVSNIEFDEYGTFVYCDLIDKETGECYRSITNSTEETTVIFDRTNDSGLRDIDFNNYYLFVSYFRGWGHPGMLFEFPEEE